MITEILVKQVLGAVASETVDTAKGSALARTGGFLRERLDADARIKTALAKHQDEILWTTYSVVIALVRALYGRDIDQEHAIELMIRIASDPTTRHRFSAMVNEGRRSGSAERIAMLAAGMLAGAEPTNANERLDRAVLDLFPDDAAALATVIALSEGLDAKSQLIAVEVANDPHRHERWRVVVASDSKPDLAKGTDVPVQSLRALANVLCIALGDSLGGGLASEVMTEDALDAEIGIPRGIEVLPLGRELHRVLNTIDWREVAKQRAEEPAGR